MTKLKIIILATLAIAGVSSSLTIQHEAGLKLRDRAALLPGQKEQLAALLAENEHLSHLVANPSPAARDDYAAELAGLRSEAAALAKQTNDLGEQLRQRDRLPTVQPTPPVAPVHKSPRVPLSPEMQQLETVKMTEARDIGLAFSEYAYHHQGQSPTGFDQIMEYLAKQNLSVSGSNQFEIIYQGSRDDLEGLPTATIAVVRDRQTLTAPDGTLVRAYGMMNGVGQMVRSDDNFQAWEALHVISKPAPAAQ